MLFQFGIFLAVTVTVIAANNCSIHQ
ncbi:hypothetical protein [Bacillus sp. OxB-1]|nr:hypothetical protein [Bacillus sp. OxB-1]